MEKQNLNIDDVQNRNLVDCALELHNEMNHSYWDLNSVRRIFLVKYVSHCFVKDNPSNCDIGSVTPSPVLKKVRNRHI